MITVKTKIRLALLSVALISISTSLLSFFYMNQIVKKFEVISTHDARIAELAENISIEMLEARREEKNFIIFLDSSYIEQNKKHIAEIRLAINKTKELLHPASAELDSVEKLVERYSTDIDMLLQYFIQEPQTLYRLQQQVIKNQQQLNSLAGGSRIKTQDLPAWTSDLNMSLLSASRKAFSVQAALIIDLKDTANKIHELSQKIAQNARMSLMQNSREGMSYGTKSQRNILTILLIAVFLLGYLIIYFPQKIFHPFKKMIRALQAIGNGNIEYPLPQINVKDEIGELSRSFQSAVANLRFFDTIKTGKIIEVERTFRRTIEEIREPVLLLYPDLKISYLNQAAKNLFSINSSVVTKPLSDVPELWKYFSEHLVNLEKQGRFEFSQRVKKLDLHEKKNVVIPVLGKSGKLESVLIIIKS